MTLKLRTIVKSALANLENLEQQTIEVFPNVGRDIAPFIVGFASVLQNYDYVLKIHTKKSSHNVNLNDWLSSNLFALTGADWIVQHHWKALEETSVGLTMAPPVWTIAYSIAKNSCWGHGYKNFHRCSRDRERLGLLNLDPTQTFCFPAVSMFWCKPLILKSFTE